ncbi:MAG: hypothetical protein AMS15_05190 [Planctomycetes bacterium DG_23]|nr:MAG: hypothetical protein AMS15_05190 [Planctomycetes bacterium DG_23]
MSSIFFKKFHFFQDFFEGSYRRFEVSVFAKFTLMYISTFCFLLDLHLFSLIFCPYAKVGE